MSPESSPENRLFKATALMASGTMISRILGFVRVGLVAFVLSNGTIRADTLTLATQVPTNIYMLFAGGALNTVLVPQIVRAVQNEEDGGEAFVNRIMTAFLTAMLAISLVVTLFTPQVMMLFTAPSWRTPARAGDWATLVSMSYITMPQLFFLGAFFLLGQVLNAKGRFGPMMWAPIVNNVVSIAVLVLYIVIWGTSGDAAFTTEQQWLLAGGSTVGIILQTAVMIPYAKKLGFRYRLRWDWRGHGLGHVLSVAKWAFGYVAVIQLVAILNSVLASSATANALPGELAAGTTVFNNSYLVYILPHSLITVSLATALMPLASELAAAGNLSGVADETMRTIRLALTAAVPITFAFLALADPFARLAFGNGRGHEDSVLIAWTLACFSIGLVGFTIQFLCLRAFYALEDTRSTFFLQCLIGGIQATIAVISVLAFTQPATVAPRLAIAQAIAYTIGAVISYRWLQRKLNALASGPLVQQLTRLILASLPAAALAYGWVWLLGSLGGPLGAFVQLAGGGLLGLIVFLLLARRLRIPEIRQIGDAVRRRPKKTEKLQPSPAEPAAPRRAAEPESEPEPEPESQPEPKAEELAISPETSALAQAATTVTQMIPARIAASIPEPEYEEGETTQSVGPLAYPEPDEPMPTIILPHPDSVPLRVGQVLDGRYLIDDIVATHGTIVSWRAFDQLLGRAVLLHVLVPHTEQTRVLLEEARRTAIATDARFLRVLDVVEEEADLGCSYIVGEYVGGQTLTRVLRDRLLTGMQAAWVGQAVAESLASMHELRLYHGRLTPDSVLITTQGSVKVIPFQPWLIGKAISDDPVVHDVTSIGWLIYAALTGGWPGRPMCGIPVVKIPESLAWPPTVAEQLPVAVDQVLRSLLLAGELPTASEVADTLLDVLGPYDGTSSLAGLIAAANITPVPQFPALSMSSPPEVEHTESLEGSPFTDTTAFTPVPPPPATVIPPDLSLRGTSVNPEPKRPWLLVLAGLFGLALVINLFAVGLTPGIVPKPTGAASTSAAKITALAFDPKEDGGDASENDSLLPLVGDGDLQTCWKTEAYHRRPDFGGLKKGVGVVLDLGKATSLTGLRVTFAQPGATVELRVPVKEPGETAPMKNRNQWRVVATATPETATTVLKPEKAETTRFVLLYFTKLAVDGKDFSAGVCDVQVNP